MTLAHRPLVSTLCLIHIYLCICISLPGDVFVQRGIRSVKFVGVQAEMEGCKVGKKFVGVSRIFHRTSVSGG